MTVKLRYWGTNDDVMEGDRIEYSTLVLRRKKQGTVVCIPPKTALELEAELKGPDDWLIRFDDGTYTGWMFHPEELQPPKRLRLIRRNADYEPITNAELERQDAEIASSMDWKYDLAGCGIIVVIAMGLIGIVAMVKFGLPW